jgi:ubiquinone/menaquinone biosynthesis C-methylase UbiE
MSKAGTGKTFWDEIGSQGSYQMGSMKHRDYMLDLLYRKGVHSLLDVGCGTAPIYELITETIEKNELGRWDNITKYKGTDYSLKMIETCKEKFPYGDFECQDARDLDEEDESWDCVLLMHSLDHIDDYKATIAEASRVSKKYVCIILWRGFVGEGTNLNDKNMINKKEGEEPWQDTHLQEYSKEALEKAFEESGLMIVEVAEGEQLNSDSSHYNFLYLLKKI